MDAAKEIYLGMRTTLDLNQVMVWVAGLIASLVLMAGCATAPVTGRSQLNLVSAGDEMKLGLSAFEELKSTTPISKDAKANAMVQRVGKQVAEAAKNDLPGAQWE